MRTATVRLGRAALVCFMLIAGAAFFPRPAGAELSAGVAGGITHSTDAAALVLRYDLRKYNVGSQAMVWHWEDGTNGAVTLDYNLLGFFDIPVDLDVGGAYLASISRINGSNLNFELTGAVNIGPVRVFYTHFSNAGINHPNAGWDFAGLAWRF